MILPHPKDAVHKAWLYRVLMSIFDEAVLSDTLYFKGGTCAAMLGYLDRFSVDLDFDFVGDGTKLPAIRDALRRIFQDLGLMIRDQSKVVPQYFLKYDAPQGVRNTIKIDVTAPPPKANIYEPKRFHEIDRIITCQTIETMMANKLVAIIDRYKRHEAIAGRDLYDIHHFFLQGRRYNEGVIRERTGKDVSVFFAELISFIEERITNDIITEDLSVLLPYENFSRIRKILKRETLLFLRDEEKRLKAKNDS
ncbi:MAG: nucleotidyl transferase AbiEii/AbiGii toxin family protein [Parcubacteria group bacterium]|nr:nucleotidyl transferase AbiEii/AbiGii toxin family protein [Parcubacteria group bacterium]